MKEFRSMTIEGIAAFVSDYLEQKGHRCILSGGACVTIYTKNRYPSFDLDFIPFTHVDRKKLAEDLREIGFQEKGRCFHHPDTSYYLDFPSPPPALGEEPVKSINVAEYGNHTLRMLTPTDSVKDRLCAFYHWDDQQSLEQAIMVAHDQAIDIKEIMRWSKRENQMKKFKIFVKRIRIRDD